MKNRIQEYLDRTLPPPTTHLFEAMRYAVLNGGKRLRAQLVYASGEACFVDTAILDKIAAAIECIHAYSLVHDDLPAMDDDDLRRGQPSCHIKYDEATAILVGDALHTFAFELLSTEINIAPKKQIEMINFLTKAIGAEGMAGGQSLDMIATGKNLSLTEIEKIHLKKTGALFSASVMLPAIASNCSEADLENLRQFSLNYGLAFQINDDLIDLELTAEQSGKPQGSDVASQKSSFLSQSSVKDAKQRIQTLIESSNAHLKKLTINTFVLESFSLLLVAP